MPNKKERLIDVPGNNGLFGFDENKPIDLAEAITGYPVYANRTGSIEFIVMNDYGLWAKRYSEIANYIHGRRMRAILDDEPEFFYIGSFSLNEWRSEKDYSRIVIDYNVDPFKWRINTSNEPWLWDSFSFADGVIGSATYYDDSDPPILVYSGYADAYSHIEIGSTTKVLTFPYSGSAPVQPLFTAREKNITLNVISYAGVTLATKTLTTIEEFTAIPELVLHRGEWLYGGQRVILTGISGGTLPSKTLTGSLIITDDAAGVAADELIVNIDCVQNLNGYEKPWAPGKGTNRFNPETVPDEDKYINSNNGGTGSSSSAHWLHTDFIPVTPGEVLYFGEEYATAITAGTAFYTSNDASTFISGSGVNATTLKNSSSHTITVPEGAAYMRHSFGVSNGMNANYATELYIIPNSETHQWTPYANVCPITGYTGVSVVVSPTENAEDGTTYSASWDSGAGTVYAGTANITTGYVYPKTQYASYNGETLSGAWKSSMDEYVPGATPTIGAQVVDLSDGNVLSEFFTPVEIPLLEGTNYVWANTGDISLTYKYSNGSSGSAYLSLRFREGKL